LEEKNFNFSKESKPGRPACILVTILFRDPCCCYCYCYYYYYSKDNSSKIFFEEYHLLGYDAV
jgi:hypothetical protein